MIHGDIKDLNLIDVLQLVHIRQQTGKLAIKSSSKRGEIFFREGNPIHAIADEDISEEAIYNILSWTEGEYEFLSVEQLPDKTIQNNLHNLIMEFTRKNDEQEKIDQIISSMDIVLKFNPEAISSTESISLQPKEWKILSMVNGIRTAEEIANLCKLDLEAARKTFYRLITSGILEVVKDEDGAALDSKTRKNHLHLNSDEASGLKKVFSKISKALGISEEEEGTDILMVERKDDSAIAAMADFLNALVKEYEPLERGIRSGGGQTLGTSTDRMQASTDGITDWLKSDRNIEEKKPEKPDLKEEQEEQEETTKSSIDRITAVNLVPVIENRLKELQRHNPTVNLIRMRKEKIDISKAEAKTNKESAARAEIQAALSDIINTAFEATESALNHETAVYRYNKTFRGIFKGDRNIEKLGIANLVQPAA